MRLRIRAQGSDTCGTSQRREFQTVGPGFAQSRSSRTPGQEDRPPREGKIWVGYFHAWESARDDQRVRHKRRRRLGRQRCQSMKHSRNWRSTSRSTPANWRNKVNRLSRSPSFGKPKTPAAWMMALLQRSPFTALFPGLDCFSQALPDHFRLALRCLKKTGECRRLTY